MVSKVLNAFRNIAIVKFYVRISRSDTLKPVPENFGGIIPVVVGPDVERDPLRRIVERFDAVQKQRQVASFAFGKNC